MTVMKLMDAPVVCRFRYATNPPGLSRVWIKINSQGCGTIAEYDQRFMQQANWRGQNILAFADSEDAMRTLEIEVMG
jgi:hypothetical protein